MRRWDRPRAIKARFDCKCSETGVLIKKGEKCMYFPLNNKVYSLESGVFNQFKNK
jgi:hypothetical protein